MRSGGKRIAIFLDGTWNSVDSNTNVWRMRALCAPASADGAAQAVYYNEGVGTRAGERWRGGLFGFGLDQNVVAAYRWLIETYSPGDDVFVFGFSRGAYTARSLTGLVARCGLLQPGAPLSINEVFTRYRMAKEARPLHQLEFERRERLRRERKGETANAGAVPPNSRVEDWLLAYSQRIPIAFTGVFDTVGALGVPFGGFFGLSSQFHNTHLSNIYRHAYQALAIDEHRSHYQPTLWTRFVPQRPSAGRRSRKEPVVEQRWFVGAHANVGGGYLEDRLSQAPLKWLVSKAEALGLTFRYPVRVDEDSHLDRVVDSYSGFAYGLYRIATLGRRFTREIGRASRAVASPPGTSTTVNETIDETVFDRWRKDPTYRPPGLAQWAARRTIDPAVVTETQSA